MLRSLAVLLLVGCAGPEGEVDILAWGEEAAVVGYPAHRTDGWAITLDSFVSAVARVELADTDREQAVAVADGPWVIDWTRWPDPAPLQVLAAPVDRFRVGFDAVIPQPDLEMVGEVDAAVVATMAERRWAHHIVGSATDGEQVIAFAWGFDNPARYTECENGADRTDGVAVLPMGEGRARLQLTMHADHVFWNTLRTEESPLAFAGIAAADLDGDGTVTVEELRATSVVEIGYETAGVNLDDLYSFIRYSLARSLHLNGGGLCRVQAL